MKSSILVKWTMAFQEDSLYFWGDSPTSDVGESPQSTKETQFSTVMVPVMPVPSGRPCTLQ